MAQGSWDPCVPPKQSPGKLANVSFGFVTSTLGKVPTCKTPKPLGLLKTWQG